MKGVKLVVSVSSLDKERYDRQVSLLSYAATVRTKQNFVICILNEITLYQFSQWDNVKQLPYRLNMNFLAVCKTICSNNGDFINERH